MSEAPPIPPAPDTALAPRTHPPLSVSELVKGFIGDLARPFAIYSTSAGASVSMVIVSLRVENGNDGAIFLTAAGALVGGIFGFKAWELTKKAQADADVAKAALPSEPTRTP